MKAFPAKQRILALGGLVVTAWIFLSLTGLGEPMRFAVDHDMPKLARVLGFIGLQDEKLPMFKGGCITPLQIAAQHGSIKLVDVLLDSGADMAFKGCSGSVGFQLEYGSSILSISLDHPDLLAHLIKDRGIDPNSVGNDGKSAIFYALHKCPADNEMAAQRIQSLKILLAKGAKPDCQTVPIIHAASDGCREAAQIVLQHCAMEKLFP